METIILNQIELKYIDLADVATNQDILEIGEPVIVRYTDGTMEMRIGDGVSKISALKGATSADLSKYALAANLQTHIDTKSGNPHNVSKSDVGLGNVDNTSDVNKPISIATQTALDRKLDVLGTEAVSGTPYKLPYYFTTTLGTDKITVSAYTIELDDAGTHALGTYTLDVLKATQSAIGLMTAADKTKLDGLDATKYELLTNKLSAFQTTPDNTHYITEKLAKDSLDLKEDKLPTYVQDKYLKAYEDTSVTPSVVKLKWDSPTAVPASSLGDYFTSSTCDTIDKVRTHFSDDPSTYWILINYDTNYYEWWRTDVFPSYPSFTGMRTYNILNNVEEVMEIGSDYYYQGTDWYQLQSNDTNNNSQFVCTDMTGYLDAGDTGFTKLKLFTGDYVALNVVFKNTTKIETQSSETVLDGGTLVIFVDGTETHYKLAMHKNSIQEKDLTIYNSVSELLVAEQTYLSECYDITATDWTILDDSLTSGVIQAIVNANGTATNDQPSFVGMVVINNISDPNEMTARYLDTPSSTAHTSTWTNLETTAGYLSQWLRTA